MGVNRTVHWARNVGMWLRTIRRPAIRSELFRSAKEYFTHLGKLGWVFFIGGVGGLVGQLNDMREEDVLLPAWAWSVIAISCFLLASFVAFHRVRMERDNKGQLPKIRRKIHDHLDWFRRANRNPPHMDWHCEEAAPNIIHAAMQAYNELHDYNADWANYFLDVERLHAMKWTFENTRGFLTKCEDRLDELLRW